MPDSTNARAAFRPRITTLLVYVAGFFFCYCAALVAPGLIELWRELPQAPAAADLERAEQTAMQTVRPRLWLALTAAVFTAALGASAGILPGIGSRGDQAS